MTRSAILLSVLGALLVTAAWYLLLVKPTQERIIETEDLIAQGQDDEFRLTTQRAALQRIEDNMLAYLAAIGQLERSIPDSPQTASLIDDLSVLADETGVSWESGSYGNPTEVSDQEYLEIPVNVSIQGQFFEVLGYLYGIADMDRLIRVDSIGISPTQDEAGFTILDVAIAARAFTSSTVAIPIVEGADGAADGAENGNGATGEDDGSSNADALVWMGAL